MKIQIVLITEFGTFYGEILTVDIDQYRGLLNHSKKFYESGFEMELEEGGYVIFPPEIVKKSVLKVEILPDI
jgi:hypothetical protein